MKITLIYLHVVSKSSGDAPAPDWYSSFHRRFAKTYRAYSPGVEHTLRIVFCGHCGSDADEKLYSTLNCGRVEFSTYTGTGWDIGAYQSTVKDLNSDLACCLATPVHFWTAEWLKPLVAAAERYGDGYYGATASFQHLPHIRTSAFLISPKAMRLYPHIIDSREKCFQFESGCTSGGIPFESGSWGFTDWIISRKRPALLVTRDRCYVKPDWRTAPNIFRRGDQSNCLVWDRHTDLFKEADWTEKCRLSAASDRNQESLSTI